MNTLQYRNLTLVYFQLFTLKNAAEVRQRLAGFRADEEKSLHKHIFQKNLIREGSLTNYTLPGFDFTAELDRSSSDPVGIQSRAQVEASLYFDRIVVVRYYFELNETERNTPFLTTDQLIELASFNVQGEEEPQENFEESNIDLALYKINFSGEFLETDHSSFSAVQQRYKSLFTNESTDRTPDMRYLFIDVGENVTDREKRFDSLGKNEIIAYIQENMMQEVNGLLRLFPYEWNQSRTGQFAKNTGENISLDVDELILLNEHICLSFATYGRDANPLWIQEIRKQYHVMWPELPIVLESALIRNYAIHTASETFRRQTADLTARQVSSNYVEQALQQNANERLYISNAILHLEKIAVPTLLTISGEIVQRLGLDKKLASLDMTMKYVDDALAKISDSHKLRQARKLNIILALLSSASVLGLLFQQVKPPFIQRVFSVSDTLAETLGILIISSAILIIFVCLIFIFGGSKK